jgi:hypothetical protein
MRLSEAFIDVAGLKLPKENGLSLELEVHVYNINYGRNSDMLKKSAILNGYSIFVNKIREYNQKLSLEESVKSAVKYCRENDILKEFLDKYGTEVLKMILEDITVEDEIEAAFEDGIEKEREYVLGLFEQGLSSEEIQRILKEKTRKL